MVIAVVFIGFNIFFELGLDLVLCPVIVRIINARRPQAKKRAASPEARTVMPKTSPSHAPAPGPSSAPPMMTGTPTMDTELLPPFWPK